MFFHLGCYCAFHYTFNTKSQRVVHNKLLLIECIGMHAFKTFSKLVGSVDEGPIHFHRSIVRSLSRSVDPSCARLVTLGRPSDES